MFVIIGVKGPECRHFPFDSPFAICYKIIIIGWLISLQIFNVFLDIQSGDLIHVIQAQILQLIDRMREELETSVLLITHDMGVVSEMADWVLVMYTGHVVEYTTAYEVFNNPKHPYTQGLIASIPDVGADAGELYAIPGNVPMLSDLPAGCPFNPRCPFAREECRKAKPQMAGLKDNAHHEVACFKVANDWGEEHV